jgi:hypothetical protein
LSFKSFVIPSEARDPGLVGGNSMLAQAKTKVLALLGMTRIVDHDKRY